MKVHDLIVIGGGPAGLAAAVNAASEGLDCLVLEREKGVGGQASHSSRIENYLGFPMGLSGRELAEHALRQALRFGAHLEMGTEVIDLRRGEAGECVATCTRGGPFAGWMCLIACGVAPRRLDVPGSRELEGKGLFYGVSPDDGWIRGRRVFVIGGANSAGQAAVHMHNRGATVTVVAREPLEGEMSAYLCQRVKKARGHGGIRVLEDAEVRAIAGDEHVKGVTIAEGDGVRTELADAVCCFIGAEPHVDWETGLAKDSHGYVITGSAASDDPRADLETSEPGVFAAGDVRSGSVKRVEAAAGEGAMAVQMIHGALGR